MTSPAAVSGGPSTRAPRQAPTDFTLSFPTEDYLRSTAARRAEPAWLTEDRVAAFAAFASLPIESNHLYTTYVDLRNAQLADVVPYDLAAAPSAAGPATGEDAVPEGAAGLAEVRNGRVTVLALAADARDAGVRLESLADLARSDPDRLRRLVEGSALPADDKLAQLTRAFWSDGVLLHVPNGARLARPIVLRWALGQADRALLARTFVEMGDDAQVAIVEEQVDSAAESDVAEPVQPGEPGQSGGSGQSFFAGSTEVVIGRASSLGFAGIQDFGQQQVAFQHRTAAVGPGSELRWAMAQLGSRLMRSRIDNLLVGDGSTVDQAEIVFGSEHQLFDLTSYTRHLGRDTTGNLLSKGALLDEARTYFKGLITIEKSAHGTDSFLGEFAMLLSRQSRSVAIPSLEIDQPDCRRAAHSSSVGPIDPVQLFYLESRGISPDEARKFIVLGYLEPVVARVPLAATQERLRELLEAKWAAMRPAGTVAVA